MSSASKPLRLSYCLGAVHKVGPTSRYFWPILTPLPSCHTLSHIPGPPESTSHISDPPRFLVALVQKSWTKVPCTKSISIVRGGFCPGGFVRVGFCPFPLLSQYICYNRNLNITLISCFICMIKFCISVTSHALDPLPLSQTVTPSRPPSPLERAVLYGRPLNFYFSTQ